MELALNSPCACVGKMRIMSLSDFGVLAQIWDVGPNLKRKSNRIFNPDKTIIPLLRLV